MLQLISLRCTSSCCFHMWHSRESDTANPNFSAVPSLPRQPQGVQGSCCSRGVPGAAARAGSSCPEVQGELHPPFPRGFPGEAAAQPTPLSVLCYLLKADCTVNNKKEQAALYMKLLCKSGQVDIPMELSISAEIWGFLFTECSWAIAFPSGYDTAQVQHSRWPASDTKMELFSMLLIFNFCLLMFP